jgi:hypothetical protein
MSDELRRGLFDRFNRMGLMRQESVPSSCQLWSHCNLQTSRIGLYLKKSSRFLLPFALIA